MYVSVLAVLGMRRNGFESGVGSVLDHEPGARTQYAGLHYPPGYLRQEGIIIGRIGKHEIITLPCPVEKFFYVGLYYLGSRKSELTRHFFDV